MLTRGGIGSRRLFGRTDEDYMLVFSGSIVVEMAIMELSMLLQPKRTEPRFNYLRSLLLLKDLTDCSSPSVFECPTLTPLVTQSAIC